MAITALISYNTHLIEHVSLVVAYLSWKYVRIFRLSPVIGSNKWRLWIFFPQTELTSHISESTILSASIIPEHLSENLLPNLISNDCHCLPSLWSECFLCWNCGLRNAGGITRLQNLPKPDKAAVTSQIISLLGAVTEEQQRHKLAFCEYGCAVKP